MVSQDFVRYELTPRDGVGFGDNARRHDQGALERAAMLGGANSVIDALPIAWEQQLGAAWPDGVDLSQGQWQRLALARGLLRLGADLACFDEPSSALDPEAERAMVHSLVAGQARQDLGPTCIVVFVTHRLMAASVADRIVVLEGGRIVEQGTPAALLAEGGHYARLHALQASGYRR